MANNPNIFKDVPGSSTIVMPLLPLRDIVVFPHMVVPFFVGRDGSIQAVEQAMASGRTIFLASQKNDAEKPEEADIHGTGTVCRILQMLKLPDGTIRVLAEGKERGSIKRFSRAGNLFAVSIDSIAEYKEMDNSLSALMETVRSTFSD